jgi:hypothetical protein
MATSGLNGPYPLTADGVNAAVKPGYPGVYALGNTKDNTFYIGYVGRSDDDVHGRLCDHIKLPDPQFKFNYCTTPEAAFYAECELFHTFGGSRNEIHPARPEGTNHRCPRTDCPI